MRTILILALTAALTGCATDDPTEPRTCEEFASDPAYRYSGGTAIVDLTGIDYLEILGTPVFLPPGGANEGARDNTQVSGRRYEVKAIEWNNENGKAVQLGDGKCQWVGAVQ